jgi:hypothetical protein
MLSLVAVMVRAQSEALTSERLRHRAADGPGSVDHGGFAFEQHGHPWCAYPGRPLPKTGSPSTSSDSAMSGPSVGTAFAMASLLPWAANASSSA